jgi:membrane associated rhomboid family serine protease
MFNRIPGRPGLPAFGVLIGVNCIVFLLVLVAESLPLMGGGAPADLAGRLALRTGTGWTVIYRMFTYGFVHHGFLHLLFNMIVLAFTARLVEGVSGPRHMAVLYAVAIYFCGLATLIQHLALPWAGGTVMGASGAICAFLFIFWRHNPQATLMLFFVIPVPIKYLMTAFIALDAVGTVFPIRTGLAHGTHLAGYLFGYLYLKYYGRLEHVLIERRERIREQRIRESARKVVEKEKYFKSRIDPILKKISEQGMESLSDFEKHILKKAGRKKP